MTGELPGFGPPTGGAAADRPLSEVVAAIEAEPEYGRRFGEVFRQAFDEVLDGQRTGRFDVRGLGKVEKTYIGTKVEIICQSAFGWPRGVRMDFRVAGHEVDAKYSKTPGGWMIPTEAVGELCLLLWADDLRSQYSVGLVRPRSEQLGAPNKDGKRQLTPAGRAQVHRLLHEAHLPENLLLHLTPEIRTRILANRRSGQARIDELFRSVPGRIVRREVVLALGRQDDAPKRVRDARLHLAPDGIAILGHQAADRARARELGLPEPNKGEWISVPASGGTAG